MLRSLNANLIVDVYQSWSVFECFLCAFQEDFDDGYGRLVITDDAHVNNNQSTTTKSTETPYDAKTQNNNTTTKALTLLAQDHVRFLQQTIRTAETHEAAETPEIAESYSSEPSSESEQMLGGGYSHSTDSQSGMTLGGMEYGSDDSQGGASKRLVISPAIYRGQNTPIAKPRQPTPSKTRRKSDKVELRNKFAAIK